MKACTLIRSVLFAGLAFVLGFPPLYCLLVPEEQNASFALPSVPPGIYHVFVVDWGYHTSIVVQQPDDWLLGPAHDEHARYVEYAWGDRGFYMESRFTPQAIFSTLVLPSESVVYLQAHADVSSLRGARAVYERVVNDTLLHALLEQLEGTIHRDASNQRARPFGSVTGYHGEFYPALGNYLWLRDCNWWTVRRLHAVGLAQQSSGVLFSGQVRDRLRAFRQVTIK